MNRALVLFFLLLFLLYAVKGQESHEGGEESHEEGDTPHEGGETAQEGTGESHEGGETPLEGGDTPNEGDEEGGETASLTREERRERRATRRERRTARGERRRAAARLERTGTTQEGAEPQHSDEEEHQENAETHTDGEEPPESPETHTDGEESPESPETHSDGEEHQENAETHSDGGEGDHENAETHNDGGEGDHESAETHSDGGEGHLETAETHSDGGEHGGTAATHSEGGEHHEGHGSGEEVCEEEHGGADVVLVLFFMLLLGLFARYALSRVPVPYTALLLILGLILGVMEVQLTRPSTHHGVDPGGHDRWEKFARGIDSWQNIQPELLLLVFLPALIYASAFSLDFHIMKRSFGQVLLLAGPGVVIGTCIVGAFVKFVFPYDWCWPKALMFGAMISATDPVAVVALLKEVGASKRLGTVIEGESLFNDGTAFVFFLLFRDMIPVTDSCLSDAEDCKYSQHETCATGMFLPQGCTNDRTFGESIEFFLQLALGGPAIGILFGLASTFWIQYIYNDLLTEISLTLVTAYLTFYVAEDVCEVSGVLAVVFLGLFMGSFAKDRVSSSVHEAMHVFWEMMEYLANTLIFVFTGLKLAIELFETETEEGKWIHGREWGYAILLFLALQIIRFITIFSLFPLLRVMGYGMTWKDALVAVWGGLRGAIGLALALIVELDIDHIPSSFRSYTIFYLGFVVIGTLLINGTTMPYLLKYLGVTKSSPEKLEVLCHLVLDMEENGRKRAMEFDDDILGSADQNEVRRLTELDVDKIIPNSTEVAEVMANANRTSAIALEEHLTRLSMARMPEITEAGGTAIGIGQTNNVHMSWWARIQQSFKKDSGLNAVSGRGTNLTNVSVTQEMLVQDMRYRLLQGVKTAYAEWLEKGYIHATIMFDLIESADEAIDRLDTKIADWEFLKKEAKPPKWKVAIQQYKHRFGDGPVGDTMDKSISKILFKSLSQAVLLLRTFIEAHHEAEHTLHEHIKTAVHEEEEQDNQSKIKMLEEAANTVIQESKTACEKAQKRLRDYRDSYPEILRAIKTRLSAIEVLLEKQSFVQGIERAGLVENREATLISCMIDAKIKHLHYHSLHLDLPNQRDLLHAQALFMSLNKAVFDSQIFPIAKPKTLKEQETICSMGTNPQNVYIITRGPVSITAQNTAEASLVDGFGSVVGVAEVMLNRTMMTTAVSETTGEVFIIETTQFLNLVEKHKTIRQAAWKLTGLMLTWMNPWGDFVGSNFQQIANSFRRAELLEFEPQKELRIKSKAYLIVGRVSEAGFDQSRTNVIEAPAPLGPGMGVYYSLEEVKVLRMPKDITFQTPSMQAGQEPRKRMLERASMSLHRRSNPVVRTKPAMRTHEASSSGLVDIPEDISLIGNRSDATHTRARGSVELQTRAYENTDPTMSADLDMRRHLAQAVKKISRTSFEF